MKNIFTTLLFVFITNLCVYSQSGIIYQAVVRKSNGSPHTIADVYLKLNVIDGSSILYSELQNIKTDANGWIYVELGSGNSKTGILESIDWASSTKYLKIECKGDQNSNYTELGTSAINPPHSKGLKGDQGAQGLKGDKGDQGLKGNDGTGVNVLGSVLNILSLPETANKGDMIILESDGNGYVWNGTKWVLTGQIKGPKGDQGIQGIKGEKGDPGQKGDQGAAGPMGVTGSQGLRGDQGIQGVKGDKGELGSQGPKGNDGTGVNVIGSVSGISALPASSNKGDMIVLESDGTGYVWNGNQWILTGQIKGPQGNQGIQGVQGIAGPQGVKGDKGDLGATGAQGTKGDQGVQGLTGLSGVKGDKGDQGVSGAQGAKGDQGVQGLAGIQGVKGVKGDNGATGSTGAQGLQGLQGIQGIKGDKGDQGIQGGTGPAGTPGATGPKGATGANGVTGPAGPQGLQGPAGNSNGPASGDLSGAYPNPTVSKVLGVPISVSGYQMNHVNTLKYFGPSEGFQLSYDYGDIWYTSESSTTLTNGTALLPWGQRKVNLGSEPQAWDNVYAYQYRINSDFHLKKNINNIGYGLEEIMKMSPKIYQYKEDSMGGYRLGFIAQDMKSIIPEIVSKGDNSSFFSINYIELIPILTKAIQEQQLQIASLNSRIESLEKK